MSRVINTNSPGKLRNYARRTIAEILRHLMLKGQIDEESKDMAALLVTSLRDIAATIETTTSAWESRDYFLKADRFRLEWEWAKPAADRLERVILQERWDELPRELAALAPRFADIRIARMTRQPDEWEGCYAELLRERARG